MKNPFDRISGQWSVGNPEKSIWVEMQIWIIHHLLIAWIKRMTLFELENWLNWFSLDIQAKGGVPLKSKLYALATLWEETGEHSISNKIKMSLEHCAQDLRKII